jgi:hypothetical protein
MTNPDKMTKDEQREHKRLQKKWMLRKATTAEMSRCMLLDRKANRLAREAQGQS